MNELDEVVNMLMTADEAAAKWGISVTTIKRWCQNEEIEARKIGNSWVMLRDLESPRA